MKIQRLTAVQKKIERIYQHSMDMRDSNKSNLPDWKAEEKAEMKYLRIYRRCFKASADLNYFKVATREYRKQFSKPERKRK